MEETRERKESHPVKSTLSFLKSEFLKSESRFLRQNLLVNSIRLRHYFLSDSGTVGSTDQMPVSVDGFRSEIRHYFLSDSSTVGSTDQMPVSVDGFRSEMRDHPWYMECRFFHQIFLARSYFSCTLYIDSWVFYRPEAFSPTYTSIIHLYTDLTSISRFSPLFRLLAPQVPTPAIKPIDRWTTC